MKSKKQTSLITIMRKSPLEMGLIAIIALGVLYFSVPMNVFAKARYVANESLATAQKETDLRVQALQNAFIPNGNLPKAELADPTYFKTMSVTAYNSVPWQTDATPCIGAEGTDICEIYKSGENICAANFIPLGTVIEVDGLGTCTVRDRMNARYHYRVDWYMGMDIEGAKDLGITSREIHLYPGA